MNQQDYEIMCGLRLLRRTLNWLMFHSEQTFYDFDHIDGQISVEDFAVLYGEHQKIHKQITELNNKVRKVCENFEAELNEAKSNEQT